MASCSFSPVAAKPASGRGALDGHTTTCTCGLTLSSSLRTVLDADMAAHVAYHDRQKGKRRS